MVSRPTATSTRRRSRRATRPPRASALGEVLRDRQFYLIYFSSFGAAVLSFMAFVHLPQQLVESGRDQMQAATIVAVIGLFSLAARLGGGAWADRIGRVAMIRVALVIMLLTSVLWAANPWGTDVFYVVAALFGITYGLSIALLPTVIADSFGNKEISRIIGVDLHVVCARRLRRADRRGPAARSLRQLQPGAGWLHRPVGAVAAASVGIRKRF